MGRKTKNDKNESHQRDFDVKSLDLFFGSRWCKQLLQDAKIHKCLLKSHDQKKMMQIVSCFRMQTITSACLLFYRYKEDLLFMNVWQSPHAFDFFNTYQHLSFSLLTSSYHKQLILVLVLFVSIQLTSHKKMSSNPLGDVCNHFTLLVDNM